MCKQKYFVAVGLQSRCHATKAAQSAGETEKNTGESSTDQTTPIPPNSRFVYPEFLPDPNPKFRNPIREKLERLDMINRRYFHLKGNKNCPI